MRHQFGAIVASVSEPFAAKLFDPVNVSAGSEPVCFSVVAAFLVPTVHEPAETRGTGGRGGVEVPPHRRHRAGKPSQVSTHTCTHKHYTHTHTHTHTQTEEMAYLQ